MGRSEKQERVGGETSRLVDRATTSPQPGLRWPTCWTSFESEEYQTAPSPSRLMPVRTYAADTEGRWVDVALGNAAQSDAAVAVAVALVLVLWGGCKCSLAKVGPDQV